MMNSSNGRSFADFAETLSFVQVSSNPQSKSTSTSVSIKSSPPDEQRSLIPNFMSWGSASTQPPSTSSSQFSSTNPSVIGSPVPSSQSALGSFAQYAKQGFSAVRSSASLAATRTQERVEDAQSSVSRYLYFGLSSLAGAFLIFLAFLFLPMVVFAPQKFALLFTLGSLFLMNGLALLKGYKPLLYHLIERDRVVFSAAYALSVVATLYATLGLRSYILTLIFAALQLAFLASLLVSYLAGGTRVLSFIKGIGVTVVKKVFGGGGDILPL